MSQQQTQEIQALLQQVNQLSDRLKGFTEAPKDSAPAPTTTTELPPTLELPPSAPAPKDSAAPTPKAPTRFTDGEQLFCRNEMGDFVMATVQETSIQDPVNRVLIKYDVSGTLQWLEETSDRFQKYFEVAKAKAQAAAALAPAPAKPFRFNKGDRLFCHDIRGEAVFAVVQENRVSALDASINQVGIQYEKSKFCEWLDETSDRLLALALYEFRLLCPPEAPAPAPAQAPAIAPEPLPAPAPAPAPALYKVGQQLVCKDTMGSHLDAVILECRPGPNKDSANEILIHYVEWGSKWDEWLSETSDRILDLTRDLTHLLDTAKDYPAAAYYLQQARNDKREIFNFFAGRFWRDLTAVLDSDSNPEQDPKAGIWEVLLERKIVRWQDLWQIRVQDVCNISSIGLVLFFRGHDNLRKHMLKTANGDPKFLAYLKGFRHPTTKEDLFQLACFNDLSLVIPFTQKLLEPNVDQICAAIRDISARYVRGSTPMTNRVRNCLRTLVASLPI